MFFAIVPCVDVTIQELKQENFTANGKTLFMPACCILNGYR